MTPDVETLQRELEDLRSRNRELEQTLDAIRSGEVDAIVVSRGETSQVYALEGADHPYRVLVETIREGALTLTAAGAILYANAAFAAMRRLPLSAILGTPLADHVAPRDRARFAALLEASSAASVRGELSICSSAGSFPVAVSLTPLDVNGGTTISVVVTDRREDYARLRLQGRMLDSVVDAVTAVDPNGTIVYWNGAAERLYGWTAEEMVGRPVAGTFDPGVPTEDARRSFEQLLAGETWSGEYLARHRDGHRFPIQATRAPVYDEDGTLIAVIGTGHDITGRKEAEEALRVHAESLRRSNEDLERFAYVASHDLQEPLRSIVSFTQLLDRRYRGKLDAEADEYIDFIVEGGNRMQGLILDLLAFSRVNTTRQQIARTDAEDVLAEAERSLDAPLREAEATLTHDPLPVVMADPIQLAQVLSNLVSNAIKFRRPDVPLRIHVGAKRLDGFWEFSVADNGIGIEPEYFEKIFVIFQRLHTRETYPGTGIGLAIVKRIVDRHGGTIRVESTPGEGSTFVFTLPAA